MLIQHYVSTESQSQFKLSKLANVTISILNCIPILTDNSAWGCDQASGWCGLGYGAQKEYYNCADIMIGAVGMPKPDVIQDPTYTDADYGSAYDMLTTQGKFPLTRNVSRCEVIKLH